VEFDAVFRPVTEAELASGITLYRTLFLANPHPSLTWSAVRGWFSEQTTLSGHAFAFGYAPEGIVDIDDETLQAEVLTDEETAPTGVSFAAPTDPRTGTLAGNLGPRTTIGVAVRWTITAGADSGATGGRLCFASCLPSDSGSSS